MKPQELEDRLIDFAVMVIGVVEALPVSKAGNHIAGQLVRSGTSPAPNYGEAQCGIEKRLHSQDEDFSEGTARNGDLAKNYFTQRTC
jgi:hypothetical protein